jgi:hypothetical protein
MQMSERSRSVATALLQLLRATGSLLYFAARAAAAFLQGLLTGEPAPPASRRQAQARTRKPQRPRVQLFAVPETPEHPAASSSRSKAQGRTQARPVLSWDKYYGTVYLDSQDLGDLSETPSRRWQFSPYSGPPYLPRHTFNAAWLDVMDYAEDYKQA